MPLALRVPSPLQPDAIQHLADAEGFSLPGGTSLADVFRNGADALYCGPRMHATTGPGSIANSPEHDDATVMDGKVAKLVAAGQAIDITELVKACPRLPVQYGACHMVDKDAHTPDPGRRLIQDGSGPFARGAGTNHFVDPRALVPVKLDSVASFGSDLWALRERHPGEPLVMSLHDSSEAYRQVPVRLEDVWQHCFVWAGVVYAQLRGYFGHRALGFWLCLVSWLLGRQVARKSGGAVAVFVDDSALAHTRSRIGAMDADFVDESALVGMPLNVKKRAVSGPPGPRKQWNGFLWDLEAFTISVPPDKLARVRELTTAMLGRSRVPRADLEALLGLVAYCAQASPVLAACTTQTRATLAATAPGHHALLGEGRGLEAHLHAHAPAAEDRALHALGVEQGEGVFGVVRHREVPTAGRGGGVEEAAVVPGDDLVARRQRADQRLPRVEAPAQAVGEEQGAGPVAEHVVRDGHAVGTRQGLRRSFGEREIHRGGCSHRGATGENSSRPRGRWHARG